MRVALDSLLTHPAIAEAAVIGSSSFTPASLCSKRQFCYKITFHKDGQVGEKAHLLMINSPLKQALPLVQSSVAMCYLIKANFRGKYQQKSVWLFVHAIMMADGPTTGGYPKIGTVASADLPLLA